MAEKGKPTARRMIALLLLSQVQVLSVWFSVSAVIPALAQQHGLPIDSLSGLSAATQLGFVLGALMLAVSGFADSRKANLVYFSFACIAAASNWVLPYLDPAGVAAHASRLLVGAALAGVYPVGMKLAVSWSQKHRGVVTAFLVAALVTGSAVPYLIQSGLVAVAVTASGLISVTSVLALVGAALILPVKVGPHAAPRQAFKPSATFGALRNAEIRRAYIGYFGHMWELYAFWAWIGLAVHVAADKAGVDQPALYGAAVAFAAMILGAMACVPAGFLADRFGKLLVARGFMVASGLSAVAAALVFDASIVWLTVFVLIWGLTIIPDSAQFSAVVGDHAPAGLSGSLLTLQIALGFGLTILTVQGAPVFANTFGWPATFIVLAFGPLSASLYLGLRRP